MTNEELVIRIQAGETDLMINLWEQVKLYAYKRTNAFYHRHYTRCAEMSVEIEDLEQEAYLGIQKAAERFKPEKSVKFLTYAEYWLKAHFYAAAKLKGTGYRYSETKLEDTKFLNDNGTAMSLTDIIPDPRAEDDIYDIIEQEYQRDYQLKVCEIIQQALDRLSDYRKPVVIDCLKFGVSYAEYARKKGVSRQNVNDLALKAIRAMKNDREFVNQLYDLKYN